MIGKRTKRYAYQNIKCNRGCHKVVNSLILHVFEKPMTKLESWKYCK